MFSYQTNKSHARALSSEFPIGDPYGGPVYGEKRDVGSVIGAVAGPVVSGLFGQEAASTQAGAAQSAADTSAAASRYATDLQRKIYEESVKRQEPWLQAGQNALAQLVTGTTGQTPEYLRSFSAEDFQTDPGYGFRLSEGLKAIQNSAAARGGLLSGAALKGISRYGQDLASNEYQNAFNRFQANQANKYNRLASMAGVGQTAANTLGTAGQQYASNVGNIGMQNAGNIGTAQLIGGQARASAYGGLGSALGRVNWGNVFTPPTSIDNYGDIYADAGGTGGSSW